MEPTLGEIKEFAFDREPENFMLCDGRLLPVKSNEPLFNLIGYKYGGEGEHFAIPKLNKSQSVFGFADVFSSDAGISVPKKFIAVKGNYPVFN